RIIMHWTSGRSTAYLARERWLTVVASGPSAMPARIDRWNSSFHAKLSLMGVEFDHRPSDVGLVDEDGRQWRHSFSVAGRPSRQRVEAPRGCWDEPPARGPATDVSRRSLFKGAALVASVIPAARPSAAEAQGKQIKLAYCSQLLCGVPYEVARSGGHFKAHELDVQLVDTRCGNAATQAGVGGRVGDGAPARGVAVQAQANVGADSRRCAVTGRLPLFAVVTAPNTASQIQSIKDLEGRTVGISALGNADHALTLYLLKQAGGDAQKVKFATMGVNLLEALRQGQI